MHKVILYFMFFFTAGCAGTRLPDYGGDTRSLPVKYLDSATYRLTDQAGIVSYAFEPSNPVKVGGIQSNQGPLNQRRFLNALLGPEGQPILYHREGSCCTFKTPNALFGDTGLLDIYRLYWEGSKDTLTVYLNMYDKGDLFIPVGLNAKK